MDNATVNTLKVAAQHALRAMDDSTIYDDEESLIFAGLVAITKGYMQLIEDSADGVLQALEENLNYDPEDPYGWTLDQLIAKGWAEYSRENLGDTMVVRLTKDNCIQVRTLIH